MRSPTDFICPAYRPKQSYNGSAEQMQNLVDELKPDSNFSSASFGAVAVTLVLDKDLPDEDVNRVRELTRQMRRAGP